MSVEAEKSWPVVSSAYTDRELVGAGTYAEVYSATCPEMNGERVALKIIDLDSNVTLENFGKETQVMVLSPHDNLVKYHCSFVEETKLYLVMQLVNWGSCADILRDLEPQGFDDEVFIASIMQQVVRALVYLHENELIHRDIKAGNILIDSEGGVRVADFGVTRSRKSQTEIVRTSIGTRCWMAPEVLSKEGYDTKADIWSLGITAIELAMGVPPFHDVTPVKATLAILQNDPPSLAELESARGKKRAWSKSFLAFVVDCLKKEPAERATAASLMKHSFFKKAKGPEYIRKALASRLSGTSLASRYALTKRSRSRREEDETPKHNSPKPTWIFEEDKCVPQEEEFDKTNLKEDSDNVTASESSSAFETDDEDD